MDCLLTKCIPIAHNIQTKCRLSAYFACIPIANLAHSHLLMVGPERPAVDKLRAVEVLVPNVKAAEDLNLRPVTTASASLGTRSMLHAPHQPPNLTFKELIVPSALVLTAVFALVLTAVFIRLSVTFRVLSVLKSHFARSFGSETRGISTL